MDIGGYVSSIGFELVQPEAARLQSLRFPLARPGRAPAELLELPGAPMDCFNARLPGADAAFVPALRKLCEIPRMSTFAMAAAINRAVAAMPPGQTYLNIGVYAGFSFLAGMAGNPEVPCVGVDDFSRPQAREGFLRRFDELRGPAHAFHEMDYLDYLEDVHREQLGVYLYDGDHAYEHQMKGLRLFEPFFADGCIVIVDDTNWEAPRQATIDFVAASEREYDVLLDVSTGDHNHPTWWNGLMILRATGRRRSAHPGDVARSFAERSYAPTKPAANVEPRTPAADVESGRVTIVLVTVDCASAETREAIEACRAQTWPHTDLVVLDRGGGDGAPAGIDVARTLDEALARTTGDFVGFTDPAATLRPTAVELALRLPPGSRFFTSFGDVRYAEHERAVLGR